MYFGSVEVLEDSVDTHHDSYRLANMSVVSVRRPFFAMTALLGGLFAGFGLVFGSLLYLHEIFWLALTCIGAPVLGSQLGELKFVSRDLRGSELASVIYGKYGHLNRKRREIALAMARMSQEKQA